MKNIISSESVQNKTKMTCIDRYGFEFATQTKEVQDKIYKTKKKNHTVNSSKIEQNMYIMLVEYFGENDVIHQYKKDDRYPFVCDFYIKSLDLFIELNASWTHGGHWFGTSLNDQNTLKEWLVKAENSTYYKAAIQTWTIRDVKKKQTAIDNNLNYVVFWKNDLPDFLEWINSENLVLNNI